MSDRRRLMMGHRVELARYRLSSGERVLCAERIKGSGVCVVDVPAQAGGRRYVVERNVHLDGNPGLRALLDDYIAQANDCGRVPMATSALDLEIEANASLANSPTTAAARMSWPRSAQCCCNSSHSTR